MSLTNTIYYSTDYSNFEKHPLSRPRNDKLVIALVESLQAKNKNGVEPIQCIKNDGQFPVLKSKYLIVNGNHRFWALKQLGFPIQYVVDENWNNRDMALQFTASAKWGLNSIMNYWISLGCEEYVKFKQFVDDFSPYLDYTIGLLLTRKPSNRANNRRIFYRGTWTFPDEIGTRTHMIKAVEFIKHGIERNYFRECYVRKTAFYDAFFRLMETKDFDWDFFIECFKNPKNTLILSDYASPKIYYEIMRNWYEDKLRIKNNNHKRKKAA